MKKMPINPAENQDPVAALLTLISEEVKKAEKSKDSGALRNWLELGCSALEKFGGEEVLKEREFDQVLGKEPSAAETPGEDKPLPYEENFTPEAAASLLNSCILFCDVVISGCDSAIGLKYNEETMFSPMIVLLERNGSASSLVWAAENLGVPVIKNAGLAKNLALCGKTGENIPEASFRDVSIVFARLGSAGSQWRHRGMRRSRQGIAVKIPQPLSLEIGETLFALTGEDPGRAKLLEGPLNEIRKKLKGLLGLAVPAFRISRSFALRNDEYRIIFKGTEAGRGRLDLGWYPLARVKLPIDGRIAVPDLMNDPENVRLAAKAASLVIIRHVNRIVKKRAPELLGRDEVEAILDAAEEKYPAVTGEVKSLLSLGIIREILQSLVSEQVSVRNIAVILEALADWGSFGTAPSGMITEQIRHALKRQICLEYVDDMMNLRVLDMEPDLEKKFMENSPSLITDSDKLCPSDDDGSEYLTDLVSAAIRVMTEKGYHPVILCSPKARFSVKETIQSRLPDVAVLSHLEIPSDINVVPLGRIGLGGSLPKTEGNSGESLKLSEKVGDPAG